MSKQPTKITLSTAENIPFHELKLSQSNVRKIKAGVSINDLADDIAQRTLLQSINVRAELDTDGTPTGFYEIPAGGRRYRALELLVKQKRLAKTALVPCVVRTGGIAAEDSLAENTHREQLHPLDQFRAFQNLIDHGITEIEIAARFFVAPSVVTQRLRLASVSRDLLTAYAADDMTLDQLMAFTVSTDHTRQLQVWISVSATGNDLPSHIRRMLTETAVDGCDRRAVFVGLDAYEAAGGGVTRDLFSTDEHCYLANVQLLDDLVATKLAQAAHSIKPEGWNWIETALSFSYARKVGLIQIDREPTELTKAETT